jgi:hypothetical protein
MIERSGRETPWYAGGDQRNTFMNAAFLFHGPITVEQGDTLEVNYRVVVHDDVWTEADLQPHLEPGT